MPTYSSCFIFCPQSPAANLCLIKHRVSHILLSGILFPPTRKCRRDAINSCCPLCHPPERWWCRLGRVSILCWSLFTIWVWLNSGRRGRINISHYRMWSKSVIELLWHVHGKQINWKQILKSKAIRNIWGFPIKSSLMATHLKEMNWTSCTWPTNTEMIVCRRRPLCLIDKISMIGNRRIIINS